MYNKQKVIYLDAFSGVSGDMLLGALIGVGAPVQALYNVVNALSLTHECDVRVQRRDSYGIAGYDVDVVLKEKKPHEHRGFSDIARMIEASTLSAAVKQASIAVFRRLGEAEARVHGVALEEIMFHEVGAVDSIVDIVGCCALREALGELKMACSPVALGSGTVMCAHGILPVPAPATAELLRGVPAFAGEARFELTTPTGAALVTTLCDSFGPMPPMTMTAAGYGLGKRDTGGVNALRAIIGETADTAPGGAQSVSLLETNIDDMTGEELAFAAEELLAAGALDVWMRQIIMKKGRPGVLLSCLCEKLDEAKLTGLIFKHTATLGIRKTLVEREIRAREVVVVDTSFGAVPVKIAGGNAKAEYEACARIAREKGTALRGVSREAEALYRRKERNEE